MSSELIRNLTKSAAKKAPNRINKKQIMPRFSGWFLSLLTSLIAFQIAAVQVEPAKQSEKSIVTSLSKVTPFSKVTYIYTQGPFAGASYQVTTMAGDVKWFALAGPEQGKSDIEKQSAVLNVADGVFMITWLEHKDPYTVTITLNTNDNTMIGIVSNESGHYVNSGKITAVE